MPAVVAVVALACLAGAATLPGVPRPDPLVPSVLESSTSGCGLPVIDDWVDDGHVQGSYLLRCYRDAISGLPEDLRAYSSAPDDLERAMQTASHAARSSSSADEPGSVALLDSGADRAP